jgi:phage protein D
MKKAFFALAVVALFSVSACHYGQDEAKQTIQDNEKYKTENKDYSINRAGERGKKNNNATEVATPAAEQN